jgi:hypothetical protein
VEKRDTQPQQQHSEDDHYDQYGHLAPLSTTMFKGARSLANSSKARRHPLEQAGNANAESRYGPNNDDRDERCHDRVFRRGSASLGSHPEAKMRA